MAEASIMKEEDMNSMLEALFCACRDGSFNAIDELINAYPDIDLHAVDQDGRTALHVACCSGNAEAVALLHHKGADVTAVAAAGDSALHFAARYGHGDVVRYLCGQNVDINARNQLYETALHFSTYEGHEEIVDFLCQIGADLNLQNIHGSTALHVACERCDIPIGLRLLQFRCFMDITDQNEESALHIACRQNLLPIVQTMCAYGCHVDLISRAGQTPLHLTARAGNADIARCLLLSGAETDKLNRDQVRAEDVAIAQGNTEVADLLSKLSISTALDKRDLYIKQLLPTMRPMGSIKIKVFGNSGVGKSAMIESLKCGYLRSLLRLAFPGAGKPRLSITPSQDLEMGVTMNGSSRRSSQIMAPMPAYTRGINVQQVNIAEAGDLSIWEFSGYEMYYLLYDQFLGEPNCIHVVVVNMKDSDEVRLKQIKFWLNFIRARMAPTEPIGFAGSQLVASRVLLVATHADEAQCPRNAKGHYTMIGKAAIVNDLLREFGADLLVAPYFIVLDSNQPSSPEMKALRSTIAAMKNYIVEHLPPCLGLLEATVVALPQWIKILSDFPIVSWPTFIEYIRSKVNMLATEEHVREVTRQLQLVGEIVALNTDDDNDDMLVLSPQWLCSDVIGRFLAHERVIMAPSNSRLTVDYIRSMFPRCDIGDITTVLETLEISSRCQINNEVEYDVPCLNVLECPKKLWEQEDNAAGSDMIIWGGVQISAPVGMEDQLPYVFPRLQTYIRRRFANKPGNYIIYHWRLGTKIRSSGENIAAIVELRQEANWVLELKCRGSTEQRKVLFFFQEELCEIIFSLVNDCCPGMYLERRPISVAVLTERRNVTVAYEPRTILLAQLDARSTVQLLEPGSPTEQLIDLVAYGSQEVFNCMRPGTEMHISGLSLYARYVLSCLLDPTHPLGHDWCLLAVLLGLSDQLPRVDINEAATLSKTDAILALWSRDVNATFGALHTKLLLLDRSDVVDALLSLTPLYRYSEPEGGVVIAEHQRNTHRHASVVEQPQPSSPRGVTHPPTPGNHSKAPTQIPYTIPSGAASSHHGSDSSAVTKSQTSEGWDHNYGRSGYTNVNAVSVSAIDLKMAEDVHVDIVNEKSPGIQHEDLRTNVDKQDLEAATAGRDKVKDTTSLQNRGNDIKEALMTEVVPDVKPDKVEHEEEEENEDNGEEEDEDDESKEKQDEKTEDEAVAPELNARNQKCSQSDNGVGAETTESMSLDVGSSDIGKDKHHAENIENNNLETVDISDDAHSEDIKSTTMNVSSEDVVNSEDDSS